MSKYPCGICSIGVKHKGIFCNGTCQLWYHSRCLNWTDKEFKKITEQNINIWQCSTCTVTKSSTTTLDTSSSNLRCEENLKQITERIVSLNEDETDLNNSLSLAAEAGKALLEENEDLKIRLHNQVEENRQLKINSLAAECKLAGSEARLEEMEEQVSKYTRKIEDLTQKLAETETQILKYMAKILKEKKNSLETQNIFEEHDKQQAQHISDQDAKIHSLEKIIFGLKNEMSYQNITNHREEIQPMVSTGTQTTWHDVSQTLSSSILLTELKSQQVNIIDAIKELDEKMQFHCSNVSPISAPTPVSYNRKNQ